MATDLNSHVEDSNQGKTIHQEPGSEKPAQPSGTPFFKDLLSRRVPQILGGYLAGSWIIFEFVQWLVSHYTISPHLEEFCLIALASLIPTVFLLAYFHGKPGSDPWTKVEKIGIPTNLAGTAVLLIFLFQGKDLGATTTSVSVVDELGQQTERVIPKSEFRKKIAIFSLENETGDTIYDWMMHAVPDMIRYDLLQDIYMDISMVYDFYDDVRDAGYPEAINIPMPLKKKIAEENYKNYFISGKLSKQDDRLCIQLTLHDTRTTKTFAEASFTGRDIFDLVDIISIWLKESLSLPSVHLEKIIDLPVSEILTNSAPASESFYSGYNQCILETNWEDGMKLIKQSLQQDTTFAYAYLHSYNFHFNNNQTEEFKQAFGPLMQHSYKIPEGLRFKIKHDYYYYVKQEPDLALEVAKTYAGLYPEDVKAHRLLTIQYRYRNDKDNLLTAYKRMLTLDPRQLEVLWAIGYLYRHQGMFKEALEFFQQYADEFPQNSESYTHLGNLHRWFGKYDQARSYYQKALLMDPDKISILLFLANIETDLGNFNEALEDYQQILEKCAIPQERVQVYMNLENYYFLRGEVQKAIECLELRISEQEKYDIQSNILDTKIFALERYIIAGKSDIAFQIVELAEERLGPPLDNQIPLAYLKIYLELEQVKGIEEYLEELEAYTEAMQQEHIRFLLHFARGKLLEIRGDYEAAIQHYIKYLELQPTIISMHFHIGGCYRKMKYFKKAEEHLQKIMALGGNYWPEEVFELGLVYQEWGKHDKALEYVRRANYIWENADTTYALAMRARDKLAELEAIVP